MFLEEVSEIKNLITATLLMKMLASTKLQALTKFPSMIFIQIFIRIVHSAHILLNLSSSFYPCCFYAIDIMF